MPKFASFAGALLILPISIRTFLGVLLPGDRDYDQVAISQLFLDPSAISFGVSAFLVLITALKDMRVLTPLLRAPLLFFVFYALLGGAFSLFTQQWALGLFVCAELLIYCSIASVCVSAASSGGGRAYTVIEGFIYAFFVTLLIVAVIDLLLPWTQPFSETAAGRKRFDGELLRLIAIQWSAIASITLIMSLGYTLRDGAAVTKQLCVAAAAAVVLLASGTRGALAASFAGMLVYVSRVPGSLSAKLAVILSLVAASALLYLGVGGLDAVFGFVLRESRFEDLQNVERLGGRTEYWGVAIPILLDQPFIGQGIGLRSRESGLSSSMHNAFLEAWVGAGLFGLAAFSAGLFATGLRLTGAAFGGRRSDSHYSKLVPDVALSASAVLAYLLVHGLTESILAGVNNFMSVPLLYCVVVAQAIHNTDWGSRKQKLP